MIKKVKTQVSKLASNIEIYNEDDNQSRKSVIHILNIMRMMILLIRNMATNGPMPEIEKFEFFDAYLIEALTNAMLIEVHKSWTVNEAMKIGQEKI